jgi:hypothetical protein
VLFGDLDHVRGVDVEHVRPALQVLLDTHSATIRLRDCRTIFVVPQWVQVDYVPKRMLSSVKASTEDGEPFEPGNSPSRRCCGESSRTPAVPCGICCGWFGRPAAVRQPCLRRGARRARPAERTRDAASGFVLTVDLGAAHVLRERTEWNRRLVVMLTVFFEPATPGELAGLVDTIESDGAAPKGCTWVQAVHITDLGVSNRDLTWEEASTALLQLNRRRNALRRRLEDSSSSPRRESGRSLRRWPLTFGLRSTS